MFPLNILHQDISRVGALDLKFYNESFDVDYNAQLKKHIDKTKPVVFLMGLDEVNFSTLENAFVVYLGHHGDISASIADIILPTPAYTEKNAHKDLLRILLEFKITYNSGQLGVI